MFEDLPFLSQNITKSPSYGMTFRPEYVNCPSVPTWLTCRTYYLQHLSHYLKEDNRIETLNTFISFNNSIVKPQTSEIIYNTLNIIIKDLHDLESKLNLNKTVVYKTQHPEVFQFRGDAKLAIAPWLVSLYLLVIKQLDKPLVKKAVEYFVQHSFTEFECELEEAWKKTGEQLIIQH